MQPGDTGEDKLKLQSKSKLRMASSEVSRKGKNTTFEIKNYLKILEDEYNNLLKENMRLKSELINAHNRLEELSPHGDQRLNDSEQQHPSFSKFVGSLLDTNSKRRLNKYKLSKQSFLDQPRILETGHRDSIVDVTCNKNGFIATASLDKTSRIIKIDNEAQLVSYTGHSGSVNSVRFSPVDSNLLCSASGDGTVHIWSISIIHDASNLKSKLDNRVSSTVNNAVFEKCDNLSEPTDDVHRIKYPDAKFSRHSGSISCADWVHDGGLIVSGSWDRSVILWDVTKCVKLTQMAGHENIVTYVSCHPTSKIFATSSADCSFRIWDLRDFQSPSINVCNGHNSEISSVCFHKSFVVSAGYDKLAKVWDMKNMREPLSYAKLGSEINRIQIDSFGHICLPERNGHIRVWDLSNKKSTTPLPLIEGRRKSALSCCWYETDQSTRAKALFTSSLYPTLIKYPAK